MKKIINNRKGMIITISFTIILLLTAIISRYNLFYDNRTKKEIENTINLKENIAKKENNGKLVFLVGYLNYDGNKLHDELLDIYVKTPRMLRYVETYQWIEREEKDKNGKIYYKYEKIWSSDIIDSSKFHNKDYKNPTKKYAENKWFEQEKIKIDDFELSKDVFYEIQSVMKYKFDKNTNLPDGFKINKEYITNSENTKNPNIGDTRIIYFYSDWTLVSVLAKQNDNKLEKYQTYNKEKLITVLPGKKDLNEIINNYINFVLK